MFKHIKQLFTRPQATTPPAPLGDTVEYNVYCTRLTIPQPDFPHVLQVHSDLSDPELLEHLNGFCGFVLGRGGRTMTTDKYHVLLHLQRVQHHLCIEISVNDTAALYAWAGAANAVLFTEEGEVLDPEGRVLVGVKDGKAAPDARIPHPEAALARKAATGISLAARGLVVPDSLPPLICEDELELRDRDEVIGRARALLVVALRAESVASNESMSAGVLLSKVPLAQGYLSPKELAFLANEAPTENEYAPFLWRYESLHVLAWALGLVDELAFPAAPCEAAQVVAKVIEMRAPGLRRAGEILDALDQTYRIHWHVRQQRLKKLPATPGVDADVVMERHQALNWLVRFQHAGWDEVDTPT